MTARIARGGPARAKPRARPAPQRINTRKPKKQGLLESLGFSPGFARRIGNWTLAGMTVAVVIAAVLAFRLPQLAGIAIGEGVGGAGFTLRRVEIRGNSRVSTLDIYNVAFDQDSMAMPLLDLSGTRQRLLQFGWIREARVSRRLPDTLVVDIVERQPAAIWQNRERLSLIDSTGVVLEPVRVDAMPDLPLLIGTAANRRVGELNRLLDSVPHLKPQITGATWRGGRRWDVRFQTREELALPEGEEAARRALVRFARMDQQSQMLGRGFVRFDMRDSRRMVVRVSREPGTRVPDLIAPDPGPLPADLAETI